MPRMRMNAAEVIAPEATELAGAPAEQVDITGGYTRQRGRRPKRCTVRRVVKLTPRQDAMLLALAEARHTNPSEVFKRLLESAYHQHEQERLDAVQVKGTTT